MKSGRSLSYWQLTPEQKQWLRGAGSVVLARTMGLFAAAIVGTAIAVLAMDSLLRDHDAAAYWRLAEGMAVVLLGLFVHLGQRWASLGLMALYTIDRITGNLAAYRHGDAYYVGHLGFWLFIGALAWAAWMRVFSVAYRAELRQLAGGEPVSC